MTVQDAFLAFALAVAVAAVGGTAGWLLLNRHARQWSLRPALVVLIATPVAVMVVGVSIAAALMLLSGHALVVLLAVTAAAALAAVGAGVVLGARVERLADAHRRLAEAHDREQATEAGRRELLAWVGHDLRAPLASIRAMAEAIEDDVVTDPATVHDYLRRIRQQTDRLSRMVTDLLDLSRLNTGGLQPDPHAVAVGPVATEVLAASEPLAHRRGVHLDVNVVGAPMAWADQGQLFRVLTNLVANGLWHTPPGGRVRVSCTTDDRSVRLAVEDGCGGIPEADVPRVFETGFRGEAARTPGESAGSGIGLAIVRGVVEAHGGTISVSNVAEGCRFSVSLPRAADGDDGGATVPWPPSLATGDSSG